MTTTTERNGVNLDQLTQTVEAIQGQPDLAQFQFRAQTRWTGGGSSRTTIQGFHGAGQEDISRAEPFELVGDEPPVLLGRNAGPNAVETVLHALTSCLTVGFVYNAAVQGIEVRALDFDIEGTMNLHGFLGLSNEVRPGYDGIRVRYRVDADATPDQLDALCEYTQRTSPVLDIVANPVPVTVERIG
jgi:uncharacterized OsmC-like protein